MAVGFASDKQKLGWFGTAWLLSLLLSSSAWALDFNHETNRHEGDAADISATLGHGRGYRPARPKIAHHDGLRFKLRAVKTHRPSAKTSRRSKTVAKAHGRRKLRRHRGQASKDFI